MHVVRFCFRTGDPEFDVEECEVGVFALAEEAPLGFFGGRRRRLGFEFCEGEEVVVFVVKLGNVCFGDGDALAGFEGVDDMGFSVVFVALAFWTGF